MRSVGLVYVIATLVLLSFSTVTNDEDNNGSSGVTTSYCIFFSFRIYVSAFLEQFLSLIHI